MSEKSTLPWGKFSIITESRHIEHMLFNSLRPSPNTVSANDWQGDVLLCSAFALCASWLLRCHTVRETSTPCEVAVNLALPLLAMHAFPLWSQSTQGVPFSLTI